MDIDQLPAFMALVRNVRTQPDRMEDVGFSLKGSGVDEAEFERAVRDRHQVSATAA